MGSIGSFIPKNNIREVTGLFLKGKPIPGSFFPEVAKYGVAMSGSSLKSKRKEGDRKFRESEREEKMWAAAKTGQSINQR